MNVSSRRVVSLLVFYHLTFVKAECDRCDFNGNDPSDCKDYGLCNAVTSRELMSIVVADCCGCAEVVKLCESEGDSLNMGSILTVYRPPTSCSV
jgi:hypothetical protein